MLFRSTWYQYILLNDFFLSLYVLRVTFPRLSAERVRKIRDRIEDLEAVCEFCEPQFEPKIAVAHLDDTAARPAMLDPLGAGLAYSPALCAKRIAHLADSLKTCLSAD
ncbi:MAG: hypothetical protein JJ902_12575 [Roseibium sp.]|nr:hypothetical protein [Roseibium sp.]